MRRASSILVPLVLALCASGQDFRATISGQVTDATGAAIPNAKVSALQRATHQVTTAVTNQDGFFTLPYLQPSTYAVEVEAAGFNTLRRENVTLMVAEKLDLPLRLHVGAVSEKITVTAEAVDLQTADASG